VKERDSLSKKALAVGLVIGLIIGLGMGYGVAPKGADTTELEQQISDLEGQVNTLQGQINEKDSQITNLQSQILELHSQIEELSKLEFGKVTENVIEVRAEGEILHYLNQSFWSEDDFSEILKSEYRFKFEQINSFNNSLQKYGEVMVNPKVEFDEENRSTTLICDVKGAMYSTNSYDFHWLLANLPFDLYAFKQSEKELIYQGEINSTPTTIKLIFPYTLTHCHEHVWPST